MQQKIDYVFSVISPWAYIGHAFFVDIAKQNNCLIRYRPVNLLKLFSESGGLPLAKRHPLRQSYRWVELQRWRASRNVALNLKPKYWPFDPALADKTIIAAFSLGHDPAEFVLKSMQGVWAEDLDLADRDTIFKIATACGLPAGKCLELAESEDTEYQYDENACNALAKGCFGSPTYWLKGEMFFGQDRLEQLANALKSGRAPYTQPE